MQSIAFIPDGNRRYAKKNKLSFAESYAQGFNKAREVVELSFENGIKEVTMWGLSTENLSRHQMELKVFMPLLSKNLDKLVSDPVVKDNDVHVNIVGRLQLLPKKIQEQIQEIKNTTVDGLRTLNLCIGYGGRAEIVDATRAVVASGQEVTEENIQKHLYLTSSPDLIVRTGGNLRLSGFLPWQSTYSEYYFSEKLWPEFDETDLQEAISSFSSRDRRFGK